MPSEPSGNERPSGSLLPGSNTGADDWTPPGPEEIAPLLPDFEILSILGSGGMGVVYHGVQRSLGRSVAIKLLPPELGRDPHFEARFRSEAQAMAMLNHPNVVQIFNFGQTREDHFYFVMEFVEGIDLFDYMKQGHLDLDGALNATCQICNALEYAHGKGFVHRDIKPGNVFLSSEGMLKVGDFGLAKLIEDQEGESISERLSLTMTGVAMGTPHYIAPEQLNAVEDIDHRADIYSLGVMLYEMITKKLPHGKVKPPSALVPDLDWRLDHVVSRSLQQDRQERYQNVVELRTDVEFIQSSETPPRPEEDETVFATGARHRWKTGWLVATPVAIAVVLGLLIWNVVTNREDDVAEGEAQESLTITDDRLIPGNSKSLDPEAPDAVSNPPLPWTFYNETRGGRSLPVEKDLFLSGKNRPWENSLRMRLIPLRGPEYDESEKLDEEQQQVFVSIWETRFKDYETFATEAKRFVPDPGFSHTPQHPVTKVNWEDADAFCRWLTSSEREKKIIGEHQRYRLPTDREWSILTGVADLENPNSPFDELSHTNTDFFVWGNSLPPPPNFGNFNGAEKNPITTADPIKGYRDEYTTSSPVGIFTRSPSGLFDLVGNVAEWCHDSHSDHGSNKVMRGGSFAVQARRLQASRRIGRSRYDRLGDTGFRVVLEHTPPGEPAVELTGNTGSANETESSPGTARPVPVEMNPWADRLADMEGLAIELPLLIQPRSIDDVKLAAENAGIYPLPDSSPEASHAALEDYFAAVLSIYEERKSLVEEIRRNPKTRHLASYYLNSVFGNQILHKDTQQLRENFDNEFISGREDIGDKQSVREWKLIRDLLVAGELPLLDLSKLRDHPAERPEGFDEKYPTYAGEVANLLKPLRGFDGALANQLNAFQLDAAEKLSDGYIEELLELETPVVEELQQIKEKLRSPFLPSHMIDIIVTSKKTAPLSLSSTSRGRELPTTDSADQATKNFPFKNSIGMRFIPVTIVGGSSHQQRILFSIWETRVRDFSAFPESSRQLDPATVGETPDIPVTKITWKDARAFCAWLTAAERKSGLISSEHRYDLPSDHEWSCAIGWARYEDAFSSPEEKSLYSDYLPWDNSGAPPENFGNFYGTETSFPDSEAITGYRDPYPLLATVGSMTRHDSGLYDLSGNVWEWCLDHINEESPNRIARGGSFKSNLSKLAGSCRESLGEDTIAADLGFRVVLRGPEIDPVPIVELTPVKIENPLKEGTEDEHADDYLLIDTDQDEGQVFLEFDVGNSHFKHATLVLKTADINAAETGGLVLIRGEAGAIATKSGMARNAEIHIPLVTDKMMIRNGICRLQVMLHDSFDGTYIEKSGGAGPRLFLY